MLNSKAKMSECELDDISGGTWKNCQVWSHKTIEAFNRGERKPVSHTLFDWFNLTR